MGVEKKAVIETEELYDPVEALFGNKKREKFLPYPEKTVFKFFVGCLNDPADKEEYEQLLTKSFLCQNDLRKAGDVAVLDMQGTFDKEGGYHVVSRYAYLTEDVPEKKDKKVK